MRKYLFTIINITKKIFILNSPLFVESVFLDSYCIKIIFIFSNISAICHCSKADLVPIKLP